MKTNLYKISPRGAADNNFVAAITPSEALGKFMAHYHNPRSVCKTGCVVECIDDIIV